MQEALTIIQIIKRAGGASAIEEHSSGELTAGAVYKWAKIGIPDRHWPLIMKLSGASPSQLFAANVLVRDQRMAS